MLYKLIRPALFALDPETAHDLSIAALARTGSLGGLGRGKTKGRAVEVMGLDFPNPVGLAAGLDKNGAAIDGFAALGFGFVEIGTITPRPQPGNPKPRLFRLPEAEAIINRMGFNNLGVDHLLARVAAAKYRGVLGINIGKNFDTPDRACGRRLPDLPGQGLRPRQLRDGQRQLAEHPGPAQPAVAATRSSAADPP